MTSINDCIQFYLNLKVPNLTIFHYCHHDPVNHLTGQVYQGELKLSLKHCPHCGSENLIRNGHYKAVIKLPASNASMPVYLVLLKQRLKCKQCHHTVMADASSIVPKFCNISHKIREKVIMSLQDDRTLTCIAQDNNISPTTIGRWLDHYKDLYPVFPNSLQEHLAFDEVRGVHHQLHFICIEGSNQHKIVRILPNRYKQTILTYFNRLPLTDRLKVKTVTMDLNSYYQDIVTQLFPNTEIIIDRFHIIAMLTRSFNQYRAQAMKQHRYNSRNYRILKYGWRLLLKDTESIDDRHEYYDRHLREVVTASQRISYGLELDPKLNDSYVMMQNIMTCLKQRNQDGFVDALYQPLNLCPQMKQIVHTLKSNLITVLNATRFAYSNGALEGTNRMIKQIQRTAFGMSNFNHLVARINLRQMKTKPKEKQHQAVA